MQQRRSRFLSVRRPLVVVAALLCADLPSLAAHEGPPFPILMDEPVAGHVVSVWADPDIGEAQFFVIVESPGGGPPPAAPRVAMWFEPVSGRLERATEQATRQPLQNQMQFEVSPYFDQRDMWQIGFRLTGSDGAVGELTSEIESTPPGYGPLDLVIYLFPFVLLGGMWVFAVARRRRMMRTQPGRNVRPHAEVQPMPRES